MKIKYTTESFIKKAQKTFGKLYKNTFKRFEILKSHGYSIKYVWESDWNDFVKGKVEKPDIQDY